MKKKILSLLLVVSLMIAFTVTSFAGNTKEATMILDPNFHMYITFYPEDFQERESIYMDILLENQSDEYTINIYDTVDQKTVFDQPFHGTITNLTLLRQPVPGHTYIIRISNYSPVTVRGSIRASARW